MAEAYSQEDRIRKLQKLRDLAEHPRTESTLSAAARDQYERLIQQWEINPDLMASEQVETWDIKIPVGQSVIYSHIAKHLELKVYSYSRGGKKIRNMLGIEATKSDWELFKKLVFQTFQTKDRKAKELRKAMKTQLESYIAGLVLASFPTGPSKCPKCHEPESPIGLFSFVPSQKRNICGACGFVGRKVKPKYDSAAMMEGEMDGARLKPSRLLEMVTA